MKKLAAAILALVMMLSFAMAETDSISEVNFESMVSAEELALGNYILMGDDFPVEVWIPSEPFVESEIPEDAAQLGVFLSIVYYEGTDNDVIAFSHLSSDQPFDALIEALKAQTETISQVDEAVVNGLRTVTYMAQAEGLTFAYATFEVTEGDLLSIYFPVTENTDFLDWARLIVASVRPYDDSEG